MRIFFIPGFHMRPILTSFNWIPIFIDTRLWGVIAQLLLAIHIFRCPTQASCQSSGIFPYASEKAYKTISEAYELGDNTSIEQHVHQMCNGSTAVGQLAVCQAAHGFLKLLQNNFKEAETYFDVSAKYFQKADLIRLQADCLFHKGLSLELANKPSKAKNELEQALTIAQNLQKISGDTLLILKILDHLYRVEYQTDNFSKALRYAQQGERIAGKAYLYVQQGKFTSYLAEMQDWFGEKESAKKTYLLAAELQALSSLPADQLSSLSNRLSATKNLSEARAIYDRFEEYVHKHHPDIVKQRTFWYHYAIMLTSLEEYDKALKYHKMVIAAFNGKPELVYEYMWSMIFIYDYDIELKRYKDVLQQAPQTLQYARKMEDMAMQISLLSVIATAYEQTGQIDSALVYLKAEKELSEEEAANKNSKDFMKIHLSEQFEKEKEIMTLQQEQEKQIASTRIQQQQWLLIGGSVALTLLGFLAFAYHRNYQIKKRSAETLATANNALEIGQQLLRQNNEKLLRFTGIISHDILSNLDLILSTGNVLVGNHPQKEPLLQYYNLTQQTSRQLKTYCLGLLEEARRTTNRAAISYHDPMPIMEGILTRMGPALQAANFQIELTPLALMPLPEPIIEQLFQNLISNALRYATNGPAPLLRIYKYTTGQGKVRWIVEDNGPGVPPALREAIFNPRQQHKGIGQHLGLGLLRASLREHGMDIWVERRPGGGARFVVAVR